MILLPGYDYKPAYWATRRKERGLHTPDGMVKPPTGILIHSGAQGPGTAQWAWKPAARYWAQFAWDADRECYVATDYLTAWAPHGGQYNGVSIGIEMPGPWTLNQRPVEQRESTVRLVRDILAEVPSIRWITGHEFVEAIKDDPGPGVTADWWDGLGLDVHWHWVGSALLPPRT
jgi:hypothetical protein